MPMAHERDPFAPVMAALSADPSTVFGAPGARVQVLQRIDGPFSSVRRVSIRTPQGESRAYVKILKPRGTGPDAVASADRMLRREYRATLALYGAIGQAGPLRAVRPIAWLPEHRALVTEEASGRPLRHWLGSTGDLTRSMAAVGAWIRLYQSIGGPAGQIELTDVREYVDARLRRLQGRILTAADREHALRRVDAFTAASGVRAVRSVPIHADLTPDNVLVDDEGRLTVLDFTMAKTGPEYHDLSHFYFHLELIGGRGGRSESIRGLQGALLRGYSAALTADDPLFRLLLLQHAVCHVAQMAERRVPVLDRAYRWLIRRRWRRCERMLGGALEPQAA